MLTTLVLAPALQAAPAAAPQGTFQGRWEFCTLPGDGGGNCTARAPLTVSGTFSIIRGKDRVVE